MPLSCSCDWDYEFEPGDWYFEFLEKDIDFELFCEKRRKRCISCGSLIDIGADCLRFTRVRYPYTDKEARFAGWDNLENAMENEATITGTDLFQCEKCGEIWLNLQALGFECLSPSENMQKAMEDYIHDYQPPKLTK
jgi:predicted RNA-binding Zn-ribbon protein involved in translation (DUF1610 family)